MRVPIRGIEMANEIANDTESKSAARNMSNETIVAGSE
jgi:hypothetical protein